jgi:hypothetical protein
MAATVTFRPRERRLALIAGMVIGVWLALTWAVQPLWERVRDVGLGVETRAEKLHAVTRLLEQGPAIERAYHTYGPYLAAGDGEAQERALLQELESLARAASVQLNLKPRLPTASARATAYEIELDAEGAQPQLLEFLDALLRLPRLVSVERLRIAVVPAKPDTLRATLTLECSI